MSLTIRRRYSFEAAHRLEWHPGKCRHLHGHSYVLEVELSGPVDDRGVIMDFDDLDKVVAPALEKVDHSYLNDHLENPTVERIVAYLAELLAELPWSELRLWETERASAVLRR